MIPAVPHRRRYRGQPRRLRTIARKSDCRCSADAVAPPVISATLPLKSMVSSSDFSTARCTAEGPRRGTRAAPPPDRPRHTGRRTVPLRCGNCPSPVRQSTISALPNSVRVHMPAGRQKVQIERAECVERPGGAWTGNMQRRIAMRYVDGVRRKVGAGIVSGSGAIAAGIRRDQATATNNRSATGTCAAGARVAVVHALAADQQPCRWAQRGQSATTGQCGDGGDSRGERVRSLRHAAAHLPIVEKRVGDLHRDRCDPGNGTWSDPPIRTGQPAISASATAIPVPRSNRPM